MDHKTGYIYQPGALPLGPRSQGRCPRTPVISGASPLNSSILSTMTKSNKCALRTILICLIIVKVTLINKLTPLQLNNSSDIKSPNELVDPESSPTWKPFGGIKLLTWCFIMLDLVRACFYAFYGPLSHAWEDELLQKLGMVDLGIFEVHCS